MSDKNEDDGDSSLPSHTLHMRRAVKELRTGIEKLRATDGNNIFACIVKDSNNHHLLQSAWLASQKYEEERKHGLLNVHGILHSCCDSLPIDNIRVQNDGYSWHRSTKDPRDSCGSSCCNEEPSEDSAPEGNDSYKFKQQYCVRNIPCVIRGLDESYFADISSQWCRNADENSQQLRHENDNKSDGYDVGSDTGTSINTEWFRRFVGSDTLVPVRIDQDARREVNGLDDDGRAEECETKHMKLREWIVRCQKQPQLNERGYLKDWHLVQYLSEKQNDRHNKPSPALPLYTTPQFFERDLLNKFLKRYSDGGDYMFVYWGPQGSQTRLHSDVLYSFSWSYNVLGKKKWIFQVPFCHDEENNHIFSEDRRFEVIQHTGEAIFVPSAWKHEVVNLVETLSINHNWITSANIDQTWHCLSIEIAAIEEEVGKWGVIPEDDFGARENMLRGCVGLDVTMFTLMVTLEIVELLLTIFDDINGDEYVTDRCEGKVWDSAYSIFRLETTLSDVMRLPNIALRLGAILKSQTDALEVCECATEVTGYACKLIQVPT